MTWQGHSGADSKIGWPEWDEPVLLIDCYAGTFRCGDKASLDRLRIQLPMERRKRGAEAEANELEKKIEYSHFRAMLMLWYTLY